MSRLARRPRANHAKSAWQARTEPGTWVTVNDYRSSITARDVARRIRTGYPIGDAAYGTPYMPAEGFETRMEMTDDAIRLQVRFTTPVQGVRP
jgi:hypothetical protein